MNPSGHVVTGVGHANSYIFYVFSSNLGQTLLSTVSRHNYPHMDFAFVDFV